MLYRTPTLASVVVYGTRWCAQSQLVRRYLERLGIPYRFVDLEEHPEAVAQLRWWTGGYASHPTVYVGGEVLVEPSLAELERSLMRRGLL
ncbi:glutaredoxin [Allomeiothermus silvanus DSM 9946]|uniref:Glutaredoxin n=1 Tax=Allomeiothermus silvanus (strain ATCC 700542 / DSM 9946 / NBRC 106475 / NCIMB 13440 / VI-R2) TaxID=526227 RepID=D7BI79_ALLS1|nr:glutaredoxin family protein [Allomeiothermus silvanus]ADH62353.1 glutaredoxin [Allomeiothermus silvanus DSM 9946]